jgi:outer membrane protein OmpA-like peptidoglycan-associated protein
MEESLMRSNHVQQVIGVLVFWAFIVITSTTGYAQKLPASKLREVPREEEEKIVPVSRATINIEVALNKQCGSPFYSGEKAVIYFKTDVDGYVTLYDIDTQGGVLVIFPNRHTPDNFVRAGQSYQIPAQRAGYDLIVEGPEGIEYVEAVASTNPYYHWNFHQGEPRWLREWGLKGQQKGRDMEVRDTEQKTVTAYKKSKEYKRAPKEFGDPVLEGLAQNFELSQTLREQVRSKLVVRPREDQPSGGDARPVTDTTIQDYNTASCYFYVVAHSQSSAPRPYPSSGRDSLEQQEQDFRQLPGFEVERQEDRLIVAMPSRVLFDSGSYELHYASRNDLNQVANILLRYPKTTIVVMGHTDSRGNWDDNQYLSELRAGAVANYLINQGVERYRISWVGYGESMPIASNSTESGRQRNRRVELEIRVNE